MRHVATPAGARWFHEPIGSPIGGGKGKKAEAAIKAVADKKRALEDAQLELGRTVSDIEVAQVAPDAIDQAGPAAMDALVTKAKTILKQHPELMNMPEVQSLVDGHPEITGRAPHYDTVAQAYGWNEMDQEGGDSTPEALAAMHFVHQAQINSKWWSSNVNASNSEAEQYAASLWQQYQNPQLYGAINETLRQGHSVSVDGPDGPAEGPSPEDMARYVDEMFKDGGTKTTAPTTLYRALHSSNQTQATGIPDWAQKLQPGTTFTDKGIMSTTPHRKFAEGWLGLDPQGNEVDAQKPDDVVLEIRVPAGTSIVGGDPQFIEAMLPRNTTLKVLSSERVTATDANNPLYVHEEDPFAYTHVVAEVVTTK